MPSTRFLNLPREKRERITAAAVAELSRVPFAQLSINRIIAAADIPRGSFYQYFSDKDDLLEYIMAGYQHTMLQHALDSLEQSGGDVFAVMLAVLDFTIEFSARPGNYDLCRNVFLCIHPEGDYAFSFDRMNLDALLERYGPGVNRSAWRATGQEDLRAVAEILVTLMHRAVTRLFAGEDDAAEVRALLVRELDMLKHGVLRGEGDVRHD